MSLRNQLEFQVNPFKIWPVKKSLWEPNTRLRCSNADWRVEARFRLARTTTINVLPMWHRDQRDWSTARHTDDAHWSRWTPKPELKKHKGMACLLSSGKNAVLWLVKFSTDGIVIGLEICFCFRLLLKVERSGKIVWTTDFNNYCRDERTDILTCLIIVECRHHEKSLKFDNYLLWFCVYEVVENRHLIFGKYILKCFSNVKLKMVTIFHRSKTRRRFNVSCMRFVFSGFVYLWVPCTSYLSGKGNEGSWTVECWNPLALKQKTTVDALQLHSLPN